MRITTTDQLVLQQDDITSNHLVVLANEKSGITQLQQLYFAARQVCIQVENMQRQFSNFLTAMFRDELGDFVAVIIIICLLSNGLSLLLRYYSKAVRDLDEC